LIAWPIAWFVMNRWLQGFAYRTTMDIDIFIFAGLLTLAIALITVSYSSGKLALLNPTISLRNE